MTRRPMRTTQTARNMLLKAATALLLSAPMALLAMPVHAAGFSPQSQFVYPRAGVSSEAYRTPVQQLTPRHVEPSLAAKHDREPARLAQVTTARPINTNQRVVPVAHRDVKQVSRRKEKRQSVKSELQKLYEAEGREMPKMTTPSYQQKAPTSASATPQVAPRVQSPAELTYEQKDRGVMAGLFDFARRSKSRSASRGYGGQTSRPPTEPRPFQPPTYRQRTQQRSAQTRQARAPQTQSSAARQQAAARTAPANTTPATSVGELRKVSPGRKFDATADAFFPSDATSEDAAQAPAIVPNEAAAVAATQDDSSDFFPAVNTASQPPSSPAVDAAVDSLKAKMQEHLQDKPQNETADAVTEASADGFKMPEAVDAAAITPQPVPAVASEVVTTNVAPLPPSGGPAEPAPFFSDEERAIDPHEEMDIAALTGQTFDPSGADSESTAGTVTDAGSQMQQIAARDGVGLKGYCPVALRDQRRLADGLAAYVSFYHGKAYYFSSVVAKESFDSSPSQYAPAASGEDITLKLLTGEVVEGSLDHSVWYKDRLYLFQSSDNLNTFMAAPAAMAVTD